MALKNKIVIFLSFLVLFGIGFKKIIDYQDYNPTVIIETDKFQSYKNKELLKGEKIIGGFEAKNNNLGIVSVLFDTHNQINDDYLQFSIKEIGNSRWYYSNKYKVDQFQNNTYFPFGFPEISNSKGKLYQIEIESLSGTKGNSVKAVIENTPFLSKYSFPKTYLLQNKKEIPIFLLSKIKSCFNYVNTNTYLFILLISLFSIYLLRLINVNKFLNRIKKIKENKIFNKKFHFLYLKIKENKLTLPVLITFSVLGLFIVNLLINGPIRLKALAFSDDLISWDIFNANSNKFLGYIFQTGANKFRPIFKIVFFGLFKFIGTNIWLFGIFNLAFNFLIATVLFFLFCKISRSIIISFCLSIAFILSRFAYYNITQALGIMEAMALLLSVLVFYLLWRYLNTEKIKFFWISLVIFSMLIFTHERFITILGVYFILFLILGLKRKNVLLFVISALPVILSFVLKIFVLQIRPLDGTGGTDILKTFNIPDFFQFFLSACFYLFGVNAGPTYINGISSEGVPQNINNLIFIGNICLLFITSFFGILILKCKKTFSKHYIKNLLLFFSFIFSTLIAASVTFRLEMRWLYVPFVGLLFLLAYIFRVILKNNIIGKVCLFLFVLWLGMFISTEMFYRSYYKNIYYWGTQTFGNALYEATLEKYNDDFWNYKTYIVCSEKTSSFMLGCDDHGNINSFFRQFEKEGTKANFSLINKISEIPLINDSDKLLVIYYDQQLDKFIDFKKENELY